jgi:hypothetical protein
MGNKQTAVDWLEHELIKRGVIRRGFMIPDNIFNQAKAMEKEQIMDAWLSAWKDSMINPLEDKYYEPESEQYYNEEYGGNK